MRICFFFILFICGTVTAQAQQFAPVGAEWYYFGTKYSTWGTGEHWHTLLHATVEGDTAIDGMACRRIRHEAIAKTSKSIGGGSVSNQTDTFPLRTLYVYDNTDTVFIYNENFNRFTPLYVFNVAEGDTVCLPVVADIYDQSELLYHPATGDTSFCLVIDSIRYVRYDTTLLRTFYTSLAPVMGHAGYNHDNVPVYNWSINQAIMYNKGVYAERVGGVQGGLLPVEITNTMDKPTAAVLQNEILTLRCYHDEIHEIKLSDGPCDSLPPNLTVGVEGPSGNDLRPSVYPNPAHDAVTVSWSHSSRQPVPVTVTDVWGRVVWVGSMPPGQAHLNIPVNDMADGLYFLKLGAGEEQYYGRLSVLH